jgi:hypothetical protein
VRKPDGRRVRRQVMIEGARDYLRDHLSAVAGHVVRCIDDPHAPVREAALVALDEMSGACT